LLGWLIGGTGIVTAAYLWFRGRSRSPIARAALPPSPLVLRLGPLLSAVEGLRSAAEELSAEDLWLCAPPHWVQDHEDSAPVAAAMGVGIGPGRQVFMELSVAIDAVSADDQRELARIGFDLARLRSALAPTGSPGPWRAALLRTFESLEHALGRAPDPYR